MPTPRVCDRVVDRLRGLSLCLKSEKSCIDNSTTRSSFILLEALLCRHVISLTSRKGRIVSVNQFACSSFLGSSFIHQDIGPIIHESDCSRVEPIVRVSNRSGRTISICTHFLHNACPSSWSSNERTQDETIFRPSSVPWQWTMSTLCQRQSVLFSGRICSLEELL